MKSFSLIGLCFLSASAFAGSETVRLYQTTEVGKGISIGTVKFTDTKMGLLIEPRLSHLSPGLHGFHVHDHASCDHMGMAAMGHLDPAKTNKHLGPYRIGGHLGDLPALYVNAKGQANLPILAPRLTLSSIKGHALMVHAGGDNYSDHPEKLGGGGARVACGVI